MCGIFSLHDHAQPVTADTISRALGALRHRGPDGMGEWVSPDRRTVLGHTRLSIIDLSTGAQPLHSEDGRIHAVVNGEFYGYDAIRQDLITRGHRFATRSDSEIALHLYEEHGLEFVHHLRGEFALIIVDERNHRIIAARDRFGIKPLCYTETDGRLYMASEAKAIFAAGFRARWDMEALYHACSLQYAPADRTIFSGIRQVPPGHLLIHEKGKTRIQPYWDVCFAPNKDNTKSDSDWIAEFRHLFEESVRLRLQADVPICTHLSGGIDSASMTAVAATHVSGPLDSFIVRFAGDSGYDEYPVAREMADKAGVRLNEVAVDGDDIADHLADAAYYSEGLSINHHLVGKYLLNRAIRAAGYKVALSGEGADEMLAGYPHFREDLLAESTAPGGQRHALYTGNAKLAGVFLADGETLDTSSLETQIGFVPSFITAKASLGQRIHGLLDGAFVSDMQETHPFSALGTTYGSAIKSLSRVDAASHLWIKTALANYILRTLGDGCEMPHAIEGRVPFLDHRLFEFTRNMPAHLKIKDMTEKHVLRESTKDLLTETLYKRQKHPFIAPPSQSMMTDRLRAHVHDTLRGPHLAAIFDRQKTLAWLDQWQSATPAAQITAEPVLMTLLTATHLQQRYNLGG